VSCHEKAWSGKFGDDWEDRREKSEGASDTKVGNLNSLRASWKDNVSPTQLIRASEDRVL